MSCVSAWSATLIATHLGQAALKGTPKKIRLIHDICSLSKGELPSLQHPRPPHDGETAGDLSLNYGVIDVGLSSDSTLFTYQRCNLNLARMEQ